MTAIAAARSPLGLFWHRLRADRVALAALAVIAALALVAIAAPLVTDLAGAPGPAEQNTEALDEFGSAAGPSAQNLLGTDGVGRDVFSRVVHGARVSLGVALAATAVALLIGTALGVLAGYRGGWADSLIARGVDVMLAFPVLLFAVGVAGACDTAAGCAGGLLRPGVGTVIVAIAIPTIPYFARIARGQALSLRETEWVAAARSIGASDARIMLREILPNLAAPLVVYASLVVPANILLEAALSFLGVGVEEPVPSWGAMIADAVETFDSAWWYMLFPGLALFVTVLAFNLLGDGLQDALDPRAHPPT